MEGEKSSLFPEPMDQIIFGLIVIVAWISVVYGIKIFIFEDKLFLEGYLNIVSIVFYISFAIFLIFSFIGANYFYKTLKLKKEELKEYELTIKKSSSIEDNFSYKIKERWNRVEKFLEEESQNSWRAAVIESDIILEDILTHEGFEGETLGVMLKTITRGDINSIENLWNAHKYRNKIVHKSERIKRDDVLDAIANYKRAFIEMKYIKE